MKDHLHHKNSLLRNMFAVGILGLTLYLCQLNTVAAMPIEVPGISQTPTLSPPQETVLATVPRLNLTSARPRITRTSTPRATPTRRDTNQSNGAPNVVDQCLDKGGTFITEQYRGRPSESSCIPPGVLSQGCVTARMLNAHGPHEASGLLVYCVDANHFRP